MVKEKKYDELPDAVNEVSIKFNNNKWNSLNEIPNNFNKDKLDIILEAMEELCHNENNDISYNDTKWYLLLHNTSEIQAQEMLLEKILDKGCSANDLIRYCVFTELMGDTFIRILK